MKIIIDGRHVKVTNALREYSLEKANKLVKFFDGIQSVHITLGVEKKTTHAVEVVITASRGKTLICHTESKDLYSALDMAESNMKRQIRRHKEKLRSRRQQKKAKSN